MNIPALQFARTIRVRVKTDRYGCQFGLTGESMSPSGPYTPEASPVQYDILAYPYNSENLSMHDPGIFPATAAQGAEPSQASRNSS